MERSPSSELIRYFASPALAIARIAPKICRNSVLRVLRISKKSVHFRQSYTRTREYHQNGP